MNKLKLNKNYFKYLFKLYIKNSGMSFLLKMINNLTLLINLLLYKINFIIMKNLKFIILCMYFTYIYIYCF